MEENKRKLKKDIISLICVIVIICGLIVLTYLLEIISLMFGLIYMLFLYVQLELCSKFKNGFVKLLPMIIMLIISIVLLYKTSVTTGLESLGYIGMAMITGTIFVTCLLVWGISLIVNYRKKKREVTREMQ